MHVNVSSDARNAEAHSPLHSQMHTWSQVGEKKKKIEEMSRSSPHLIFVITQITLWILQTCFAPLQPSNEAWAVLDSVVYLMINGSKRYMESTVMHNIATCTNVYVYMYVCIS